jgi:hypothetical protein
MRRLDKSQEHLAASELLFALFKGSIALEQLAGTFRSAETDRHMRTFARKTLAELRRSLHVEFASRAAFGAPSPYADFEQRVTTSESIQ